MKNKQIERKNWQLPETEIHEISPRMNEYCVIIPVINEGTKIQKQLEKMRDLTKYVDVIICDGDSTDKSLSKAFLRKQKVRTLLIKKSPGKQGTQIRMGLAYAMKENYKGVIQVDGNNKDGVDAIPRFIEELKQGYDYIQGSRFIKGGKGINTPLPRWIGVRLLASPIISLATGFWYTDIPNGFRGYSRRYILHPKLQPFRNIFVKYELILYMAVRARQLGLRTKEIPVSRSYPKGLTPTKISPIVGNWDYFLTTVKAALGLYNPKYI